MTNVSPPQQLLERANVPERQLFGPGPSNLREPIQEALTRPMLGHLHAEFLKVMDDARDGINYLFQTRNALTFAVSGTGHAGMECAFVNLLERGERLLVVKNGLWGARAAALARRLGVDARVLEVADGDAATLEQFEKALDEHKPAAAFVCQGESSTGVLHPLDGFGAACARASALFIVDTVASVGATPFDADALRVDCVYAATQKVLNCPPGLAPISFSERAVEKIRRRSAPVGSFYFDALELGNYWGCDGEARRYHHTGMVSLVYALREALACVVREGLDESIARHQRNAKHLHQLLTDSGFELFVEKEALRLPCLTTVRVPEGVEWQTVVKGLMSQGYEVAGGLGATAGKIWRIGTFGVNSNPERYGQVVNRLKAAAKL